MSRPVDLDQAVIRVNPPHCVECGAGSPRVYQLKPEVLIWLCASCEYRLEYPEAAPSVKEPRAMRPLKLQAEKLFEV